MTPAKTQQIVPAGPWRAEAVAAVPRPAGRRRWLICAVVFCAFTVNYVDRQVLSILKPAIEGEIGWSEVDYANIVLFFQVAYVIGTLGVGRLLDLFGVRRVMSGSILVWALAAIAHALVATVAGFAAVRFVLALGESANIPAACARSLTGSRDASARSPTASSIRAATWAPSSPR